MTSLLVFIPALSILIIVVVLAFEKLAGNR